MSRFFCLPGELRNSVYEYAVGSIEVATVHSNDSKPHPLTQVCHRIRAEFPPIYNEKLRLAPHIKATVVDFRFDRLLEFLDCHRHPSLRRRLEIEVELSASGEVNWAALERWCSRCHINTKSECDSSGGQPGTYSDKFGGQATVAECPFLLDYQVRLRCYLPICDKDATVLRKFLDREEKVESISKSLRCNLSEWLAVFRSGHEKWRSICKAIHGEDDYERVDVDVHGNLYKLRQAMDFWHLEWDITYPEGKLVCREATMDRLLVELSHFGHSRKREVKEPDRQTKRRKLGLSGSYHQENGLDQYGDEIDVDGTLAGMLWTVNLNEKGC